MKKETAFLTELLAIDSAGGEPAPGAPFGAGVRNCLDLFLAKAEELGLKTINYAGYAGEAYIGTGAESVGVFAHLDTVPAGEGWTTRTGEVRDGSIWGRGAIDDKGPAAACLYALARLKRRENKLKRRVRLIVGCNEESGSGCMKYFNAHAEPVTLGFTPDSDFPYVQCEKSILQLRLSLPFGLPITVSGGQRANVVCAEAAYTKQGKTFIFRGKAAHAMEPHKGDNAAWKLFDALKTLYPANAVLQSVCAYLANPAAIRNLGICASDERSGSATINIGVVRTEKERLNITLDLRLPIPSTKETVIRQLKKAMPQADVQELYYAPYLYADPNSDLVRTLGKIYTTETGKPARGLITGGGTYARTVKNCVAFGPALPDVSYNIHDADEHIPLEHFAFLQNIYYKAMKALADDR
ncbi:MAG: M20/M25/M40 family metallo-hydrolase [Firmicutes bacterium]|nr:M20/M25/M40 family metallo-hydrolase [Bacillota bacterium]